MLQRFEEADKVRKEAEQLLLEKKKIEDEWRLRNLITKVRSLCEAEELDRASILSAWNKRCIAFSSRHSKTLKLLQAEEDCQKESAARERERDAVAQRQTRLRQLILAARAANELRKKSAIERLRQGVSNNEDLIAEQVAQDREAILARRISEVELQEGSARRLIQTEAAFQWQVIEAACVNAQKSIEAREQQENEAREKTCRCARST